MSEISLKLVLAFIVGGLIGIERSKHGRAAGMRTHILVCVGACLASSLGLYVSLTYTDSNVDPTRIAAQIVASVGVLGAGSILKKNRDILTGLTTAAGLWDSAIIGLAIGFGFYEGAIVSAIITFVAMVVLHYLEISKIKEIILYVEFKDIKKINALMQRIEDLDDNDFKFSVTAPRSNIEGNVGLYVKTYMKKGLDNKKVVSSLKSTISKMDSVIYVLED